MYFFDLTTPVKTRTNELETRKREKKGTTTSTDETKLETREGERRRARGKRYIDERQAREQELWTRFLVNVLSVVFVQN